MAATLTSIKRTVVVGNTYDVTNHYITRPEHDGYGTTRRIILRVTASRVYLLKVGTGHESYFDWPAASQVQRDDDGTIRLYGGGRGQKPTDPFLTLVPYVKPDPEREITDARALDRIQHMLRDPQFGVGMLEDIEQIVNKTGRSTDNLPGDVPTWGRH